MRNEIDIEVINREIRAMKLGAFNISDILDGSYEEKIEELLAIVVEKRKEFDDLSDQDKLVEYMIDNKVPFSAQAVNYDGNMNFNEMQETRKNTKLVAERVLELVDNDYDKALKIVKTMS